MNDATQFSTQTDAPPLTSQTAELPGLPAIPSMDAIALDQFAILECEQWLSFHRIWGRLPDATLGAIALCLLSIPALFTYLTHAIARSLDPQQPDYLTIVYAYLPFTLAANLAYYIPAAITEAGQILPVLARTLGYSGEGLPTLTWSMDVAAFLQGVTLLSALVFSPYPLLRITQRSWLSNLPHL